MICSKHGICMFIQKKHSSDVGKHQWCHCDPRKTPISTSIGLECVASMLRIKSTYLVSILFVYEYYNIYIPRPSSPKNGGLPDIIIPRFHGQQAPRRPSLLGFELIEAPNALLSYGLMSHKSMVILGDDGWDGRIFLMHSYFASSCFITIFTAWPRVWSANSLDLEQY